MASAVSDCRPSANGEAVDVIVEGMLADVSVGTFMLRIPGSGTFESGRQLSFRTQQTPGEPDLSVPSFCRAGAFRESPCQFAARGGNHAALGNKPAHQSRRRDVEAVICHRRAVGNDSHRFDTALRGLPGHARYL